MPNQTAYPLSWPNGWKRTQSRQSSRFERRRTVTQASDMLMEELRKLGARDIILSSNLRVKDNGLPYSGQRNPEDTGVAVYFKLNKQERVLACDRWRAIEDNIWAIAKHVEALRGQERWGVGTTEQAFAGYAALPSGESNIDPWQVLGLTPLASEEMVNAAYRALATTRHPDAGGGHDAMARLNVARDMALKHLRGKK